MQNLGLVRRQRVCGRLIAHTRSRCLAQPAGGEEKAAEEEAGDEEAAAQPEAEGGSEPEKAGASAPAREDGVMKVGRLV